MDNAEQRLDRLEKYSTDAASTRTEIREKIAAKLGTDFLLSSFDLDNLAAADAYASIGYRFTADIDEARKGDAFDADTVLAQITERLVFTATLYTGPNSNSGSANLIAMYEHRATLALLKIAAGR